MNVSFTEAFFPQTSPSTNQSEVTQPVGNTSFTATVEPEHFEEIQLSTMVTQTFVILMSLLILVTCQGNVWVVIAILMRPHLRGAMANIFILNLCCVDLLASAVSMPLSVITFVGGRHALSEQACQASAFTGTLAMLVSTMTLSAIACERLYSIALPMHQAGHASLALYLLMAALLWTLSALLAVLPWIGLSPYSYSPSKRMCSLAWHSDNQKQQAVVITLIILSFIIPTILLIIMYAGVFRVAKKAASKVAPQQIAAIASFPRPNANEQSSITATDPSPGLWRIRSARENIPRIKPSISIQDATPSVSTGNENNQGIAVKKTNKDCENEDSGIRSDSHKSLSLKRRESFVSREPHHQRVSNLFSNKSKQCLGPCRCRPKVNPGGNPVNDHNHEPNNKRTQWEGLKRSDLQPPTNTAHAFKVLQISGVGHKAKASHVKALKTLLVIVLTHLILWSPFFVCRLHELVYHTDFSFPLDAAVTWVTCLSYAVNPGLYGCLNRGIREELVRHLNLVQDLCCCYFYKVKSNQGRSSLRCDCRVPCKPRVAEDTSGCGSDENVDALGGAESFFQFLQRTQGDDG